MLLTVSLFTILALAAGQTPAPSKLQSKHRHMIALTSVTHVPQQCFLKSETGPCRAHMPKYFFNITTGQCEKFVYGGCAGNGNRFDTFAECHKTCTCATPPETGPCRGHFRRWFYSPDDGCCRQFIYGGCGGNSNNYKTWSDCSNQCFYPSSNSSWWSWGAEWGQNATNNTNNTNNTSNTSNGTSTLFYSRQDFIRDWHLWGLLLREGELDMEQLATVIAQAHIVGVGKKTGRAPMQPANRSTRTGSTNSRSRSTGSTDNRALRQNWGDTGRTRSMGSNSFGTMYNSGGANSGSRFGQYSWLPYLLAMELEIPLWYGASWNTNGLGAGDFGANTMSGYGNAENGNGYDYWNYALGGINMPGNGANTRNVGQTVAGQGSTGLTNGVGRKTTGSNNNARFAGGWNANAASWNKETFNDRFAGSGRSTVGTKRGLDNVSGQANRGTQTNIHGHSNSKLSGHAKQMQRIFEMISGMSSGKMNPKSLLGFAKAFGALGQNGKININVLTQRFIDSMTSTLGSTNILYSVARGLGALDKNGNVDSRALYRRIETIFRGSIPATMISTDSTTGQQNVHGAGNVGMTQKAMGPAMKFAYLISRLPSGSLLTADLAGIAQKFGVYAPNGSANTYELARSIVDRAMREPTNAGTLAQLKAVADNVGALDANGNINVELFVSGISKNLTPGFANEVLVSRHDGQRFNIEGSQGMGVSNILGIVHGRQKKGSYGK